MKFSDIIVTQHITNESGTVYEELFGHVPDLRPFFNQAHVQNNHKRNIVFQTHKKAVKAIEKEEIDDFDLTDEQLSKLRTCAGVVLKEEAEEYERELDQGQVPQPDDVDKNNDTNDNNPGDVHVPLNRNVNQKSVRVSDFDDENDDDYDDYGDDYLYDDDDDFFDKNYDSANQRGDKATFMEHFGRSKNLKGFSTRFRRVMIQMWKQQGLHSVEQPNKSDSRSNEYKKLAQEWVPMKSMHDLVPPYNRTKEKQLFKQQSDMQLIMFLLLSMQVTERDDIDEIWPGVDSELANETMLDTLMEFVMHRFKTLQWERALLTASNDDQKLLRQDDERSLARDKTWMRRVEQLRTTKSTLAVVRPKSKATNARRYDDERGDDGDDRRSNARRRGKRGGQNNKRGRGRGGTQRGGRGRGARGGRGGHNNNNSGGAARNNNNQTSSSTQPAPSEQH